MTDLAEVRPGRADAIELAVGETLAEIEGLLAEHVRLSPRMHPSASPDQPGRWPWSEPVPQLWTCDHGLMQKRDDGWLCSYRDLFVVWPGTTWFIDEPTRPLGIVETAIGRAMLKLEELYDERVRITEANDGKGPARWFTGVNGDPPRYYCPHGYMEPAIGPDQARGWRCSFCWWFVPRPAR